jgi:putative DNA methylase
MSLATLIIAPKKLIEVALPLDAINAACAYEKLPGIGPHPRGIHLWWARRPLAAARAVIFSQLVHDPEDLWRCQNPGKEPNTQVKGHWTKARARLFSIIQDLVLWQNIQNESVLEKAREEIRKSWKESCELNKQHPRAKELFNPDEMPGLHDPFAGGGAIPLEAQRLGLETYASDLNPVAVLINKAMIEIPPKFAGRPPVNPKARHDKGAKLKTWHGAQGLAEDVRYYGQWMQKEALNRVGHLYPPVEITAETVNERTDLKAYLGERLTVIAWLWVRTVKSPNPAFAHVDVPLASTFILSNKDGKEAYVVPQVTQSGYSFKVKVGKPPADAKSGTKASRGSNFRCVMSGAPISADYVMDYAKKKGLGTRLMAVVAEGVRGRVYLSPTMDVPTPKTMPDLSFLELEMTNDRRWFSPPLYGMPKWRDIFTPRQQVALSTYCDLVLEAREQVVRDTLSSDLPDDTRRLSDGGLGRNAYADAVSIYLAFIVDRTADFSNVCTRWVPGNQKTMNLFGKQAVGMTWDFPEANLTANTVGGFSPAADYIAECLTYVPASSFGNAVQADAQSQMLSCHRFVSTDPPYYDNIGYADLSDFFYIWLRRSLRYVFPGILTTIAVPKAEELVATPHRHGGKEKAESFFLKGMTQAMLRLVEQSHPSAPITIYYAFKQSDTASDGTNSTGWETFLEAVLKSGLAITGTWPMRSEQEHRMVGMGTNALASSIVLVCRHRSSTAGTIARRQFVKQLNEALPLALDAMTRESEGLHSPVAPVDLSQAIIGPGMAIFSRYEGVLEADGTPMTVKTALQLINRFLAEDDFDADTQFCLHWFEQYGWESGKFGEADTLARAKGTSVDGVKQAGVLHAAGGNVRLLKWSEYPSDWDPQVDQRLPIWEVLHQLIRVFNTDGETGAASVFAAVQSKAEAARQLAYRLYTICERKNWAEDARAYNEVVTSWSGIESAAAKEPAATQRTLFDE